MAFRSFTSFATTSEIVDNPISSALASRSAGRFEKWSSVTLTYTLNRHDPNPDGEPVAPWTEDLTRAIRTAQSDISAVSRLQFREVADSTPGSDGADIDYWYYRNASDSAAGYSYGVGGSGAYINEDSIYSSGGLTGNGLAYGGINYGTVIHEFLHNLGLAHPHDGYARLPGVSASDDTGNDRLNQTLYTVMSYNRVGEKDAQGQPTTGYPFTYSTVDRSFAVLGAFDIAMVQLLYGANTNHATGDDVYRIPGRNQSGTYYSAVWDAGGTDEFRFDGGRNVRIDLRAATLDVDDGVRAGGIVSRATGIFGGHTIAYGTLIENATGGNGNDSIAGNGADNMLRGRGGHDRMTGMGGADTILGGNGRDYLQGSGGSDRVSGGSGHDTMFGGRGTDWLDYSGSSGRVAVDLSERHPNGGDASGDVISGFENLVGSGADDRLSGTGRGNVILGQGGNDTIVGDSGSDTLRGSGGADEMRGGSGFDWLDYRGSGSGVRVDLHRERASGGHARGDGFSGFEAIIGSDRGDRLIGDSGKNKLLGNSGHDVIKGAGGSDLVNGGPGADRMFGGRGIDLLDYRGSDSGVRVSLASGTGSRGDAAGDRFSGFERIRGSGGDDELTGDRGGNVIRGGAGDDTINGRNGTDVMRAGSGADTFLFDFGSDTLKGGPGRDHAYFQGEQSEFDVVDRPGHDWVVTDLSRGHVDVLHGIEVLHFDDGILT